MTEPNREKRRMFVAVRPPPEVIDAIATIPKPDQPGVRYTPTSQWHITLLFLGMCDPVEAAGALASVQFPSVEVDLGPAVALLGDGVAMIPAAGLDDCASAVATAMRGLGQAEAHRRFVGHLTLARLNRPARRSATQPAILGSPFSARFTTDELRLYSSELGHDGALHTLVARSRVQA